jgi:methionyl-tRNA formyltransferase
LYNNNLNSLKIIFAGTPQFAAIALEALLQLSHHEVIAVLTQPDKPAGRGLQLTMSAVKTLALTHDLPILQPATLKNPLIQEEIKSYLADVMVVAAYGMLLPKEVLSIPRLGCINIHPSLLPRWRGAAPIQRTIFAGDIVTGVTIMQMDEGLDTGPILLQRPYTIEPDETSQTLHDKMASLGAESLIETLNLLADNRIIPKAQDNHAATYAAKITKEEAEIDWTQSAVNLEHQIRAFNPKPIAYTYWQAERLRIWMAKAITSRHTDAVPGTLLYASPEGLDIATGDGLLRLLEVQLPGGKQLNIKDFYYNKRDKISIGTLFISRHIG